MPDDEPLSRNSDQSSTTEGAAVPDTRQTEAQGVTAEACTDQRLTQLLSGGPELDGVQAQAITSHVLTRIQAERPLGPTPQEGPHD